MFYVLDDSTAAEYGTLVAVSTLILIWRNRMSYSAPKPAASDKIPFINKLAFGAGDFGPAVATGIMSFFILYFLTDVAG